MGDELGNPAGDCRNPNFLGRNALFHLGMLPRCQHLLGSPLFIVHKLWDILLQAIPGIAHGGIETKECCGITVVVVFQTNRDAKGKI